ncbi:MAG: DUF3373 family protein [Desulfamplus sp.]|nr:DUF3373 family protein [Desulfamplus sp.]
MNVNKFDINKLDINEVLSYIKAAMSGIGIRQFFITKTSVAKAIKIYTVCLVIIFTCQGVYASDDVKTLKTQDDVKTLKTQDDVKTLKTQLDEMSRNMEMLKDKLDTLEREKQADRENKEISKKEQEQAKKEQEQAKKEQEKAEQQRQKNRDEIQYLGKRIDKTELHTATDKVSLGFELRSKADSIHYNGMLSAPSSMMGAFFAPASQGGFNGATLGQVQQGMQNMAMSGMVPPLEENDIDNDVIFTNKFHLNMESKLNSNLSFAGRLAAYKVWGDSTGINVNHGSLSDITLDGNTSSLPHGDTLHLERAYFLYSRYLNRVPVSFSLGRRPSTNGPPLEYGEYGLEGGSPLATIINWQFDGASLNFGLEDVTGIPGAAFKLCYGVGFEGDWGNSYSLQESQAEVEDVNLFGFIATLFDNDSFSAVLNYAHAWNITDGFTGLTVMPFAVSKADQNGDGINEYYFNQNSGGYISRMEPTTEIGDWDAASLLMRKNLYEETEKDIDLFIAGSWSHTDPSSISANPFYEMMGMGLLGSNGQFEKQDGYSIYIGALFPMPLDAKLGLEYNWGSQYWFNFTGAEDSLVGSKLATRGSVFEGYYIQPVFGQNFFVRVGARYYDYEYTGSGNPLGEPVKISDANSLNGLFPIADKVWDTYLSATMRF